MSNVKAESGSLLADQNLESVAKAEAEPPHVLPYAQFVTFQLNTVITHSYCLAMTRSQVFPLTVMVLKHKLMLLTLRLSLGQ